MNAKKSNRRAFLRGQSALDAVREIPDALLPPEAHPGNSHRPQEASFLLSISRQAMACEFQVLLNAGEDQESAEGALEALEKVETIEDALSYFRDSSFVSRLNREAAEAPVDLPSWLIQLLNQAQALHHATGGAFDITASPLWKCWGFAKREGRLPQDREIQTALSAVGGKWLELDTGAGTARYLNPDVEINLGAIGKGYAVDEIATWLETYDIAAYLVHAGQSSMKARGHRRRHPDDPAGWSVALRHPLKPEERLGVVWLQDRALGTSGAGNQFFHHQGRRYGHVLDPRTGHPAESVLSATVLAPTAAEADALATAFFVMGVEATRNFCDQRSELAAILVEAGSQAGEIQTVLIGVKDGEWVAE